MHHPEPDGQVVPKLCESCEARHRGVCGALPGDDLLRLSKISVRKTLKSGESVVCDEDDVISFSNVLNGVVKLSKLLPDGRQQIVGLQFAPDFLGRPFRAESHLTAEASGDVHLCSFPRAEFESMMRDNPELEHRILAQTLEQLDEARDWMMTLGRKTAREKIASYLLMIARHSAPQPPSGQGVAIDLPLSRGDMADFLGLTIETVSRQMTALRKAKVIEFDSARAVRIPSLRALERAAGE
ncbi:Crp/Fnr family transcriptional regulator [Mangrovicella endophytica]|uniref:Crp/Fnr family transcriptional regulator n=1 Tax=Mangrovicella endophytica TaxID=2066697 RepID=UPI0018E460AD|nr:Crp/Fnr family transcriptional regulator [Mangrovicella endophytica]